MTPSNHISYSQGLKTTQKSILVVDDNPAALHLLSSILKQEGYSTITATNGIEAMRILKAHGDKFDVILLDRIMPKMDGIEVTKKLQKERALKHIPIVMQTAADQPEQISEGIKAGVFYYLTKPTERKTLLSVISSAVRKVEQRKLLLSEMHRHKISFGLIQVLKGSYKSLDEAKSLASFLANCFPDPDRALTGISELLINAVEHGNLGIDYQQKTALIKVDNWRQEIIRRLQLPEFMDKEVTVIFEKKKKTYYLQITDQGKGFNWKSFLEFDPSRISDNHGRGIVMANKIAFDRLFYNEDGNQVTAVMNTNPKQQR